MTIRSICSTICAILLLASSPAISTEPTKILSSAAVSPHSVTQPSQISTAEMVKLHQLERECVETVFVDLGKLKAEAAAKGIPADKLQWFVHDLSGKEQEVSEKTYVIMSAFQCLDENTADDPVIQNLLHPAFNPKSSI